MRTAIFVILSFFAVCFSQDYNQVLSDIERNLRNFDARSAERELKNKARVSTSENDLSQTIDTSKKQEILDLLEHFQNTPVREYTCYQVRKVNVNVKYKCSLTGEVFPDEQLCNANCVKQHECVQSACYQVQACQRLSSGYLCPIGATVCDKTKSEKIVGYTLSDGRSVISDGSCKIGIEVSNGKIRFYSENPNYYYTTCTSGNFVDLNSNSFSRASSGGLWSTTYYYVYVDNKKLRYCYETYSWGYYFSGCGDWIEIGKQGKSQAGICYIESSSRGIRFVCEYSGNPQYGNWIALSEIRDVNISYNCPLGNYPCIEDGSGNAYCSPYTCNELTSGKYYCTDGNITSPINENVLGMWWCSGDKTWLSSQDECLRNCPYYTCSLDGKLYTGFDTCQMACREVGRCEVF